MLLLRWKPSPQDHLCCGPHDPLLAQMTSANRRGSEPCGAAQMTFLGSEDSGAESAVEWMLLLGAVGAWEEVEVEARGILFT